MGYYINGIGTSFNEKISNLKLHHNAIDTDSSFKENLVCVVNNGTFAAAAYAFSQEERNVFAEPDGRSKHWLVVPNAKELTDYKN